MTTDPTTTLARIRQMADAWEEQLPATVRTATVVEALRTVLDRAGVEPPADRAAGLRWAADQYAKLTDQNEAYDREHGELDEEARLRHEVVRDMVAGLRHMADETPDTQTPAVADCNTGPGWYEVISPRATTCIAYVHEDGSLYLPEGDALTHEEFAFAAARGNAHKLVRADDQPAVEAQQDGSKP